jgi:hypothetical protein
MTSAQDRAPRAGSGMAGQTSTRPEEPIREGKYSRIERGRRFLLLNCRHDL